MRDNVGEDKSEEIMQFLDSKGIRSHFSTPKEQWQNGAAESTINSIMLIARTVMVESGLGGRFWFRAATAGKDACNVTFRERIGMTPHQARFDKHEFPYRKRKMVEQHLSDNSTDILFQQACNVKWIPYNKLVIIIKSIMTR